MLIQIIVKRIIICDLGSETQEKQQKNFKFYHKEDTQKSLPYIQNVFQFLLFLSVHTCVRFMFMRVTFDRGVSLGRNCSVILADAI